VGLLDGIEKLITEHGSAAILRERIALANDKYSALQAENSSLKSQNAILKSENEALKLDNKKLQEQRQDEIHGTKPQEWKMIYGCLKFDGDDKALYCPACFLDRGKKIPTSRNAGGRFRFCSACKTDIPAG